MLWAAVLKSGIHATLAGVIIALFIPYKKLEGESLTQLEKLEHDLHPAVSFAILPLFAFANTGISFSGLTFDMLLHPIPLGIALGLFLGNQVGVLSNLERKMLCVTMHWAIHGGITYITYGGMT